MLIKDENNNPLCEFTSCKHNENGECIFLNRNGESKHIIKGEKRTMLCAWYTCGREEKCESCKYITMIYGGTREYCILHEKLIPHGRLACEVYKHE